MRYKFEEVNKQSQRRVTEFRNKQSDSTKQDYVRLLPVDHCTQNEDLVALGLTQMRYIVHLYYDCFMEASNL